MKRKTNIKIVTALSIFFICTTVFLPTTIVESQTRNEEGGFTTYTPEQLERERQNLGAELEAESASRIYSNERSGGFPNPFGNNITNITQILNPLIDLIINIGGILVVFFIIYAGFKMVLAQGDPGKIGDAKKMLFWSIIGGLILLGSKVLAEVVKATVEQLNV